MPMTPEAKVKAAVKKVLDQHGVYHFSPVTSGYGRSGIPDIIGCCYGRFIAIECKAGTGKTTALQAREIERIINSNGVAVVVWEQDIPALAVLVAAIIKEEKDGKENA